VASSDTGVIQPLPEGWQQIAPMPAVSVDQSDSALVEKPDAAALCPATSCWGQPGCKRFYPPPAAGMWQSWFAAHILDVRSLQPIVFLLCRLRQGNVRSHSVVLFLAAVLGALAQRGSSSHSGPDEKKRQPYSHRSGVGGCWLNVILRFDYAGYKSVNT